MAAIDAAPRLRHDAFGECELVRTEGTDWLVRILRSGEVVRFPASARRRFTPVGNASPSIAVPAPPAAMQSPAAVPAAGRRLLHETLGPCELVRVEGADWIVRLSVYGIEYRCPPQGRKAFVTVTDAASAVTPPADRQVAVGGTEDGETAVTFRAWPDGLPVERPPAEPLRATASGGRSVLEPAGDGRALRRAIESLRNGLPPSGPMSARLAIGVDKTLGHVRNLLTDVAVEGGRACVIRGAYGQGKTFCLQLLKETALAEGYLVASTEIDAYENQIQKPNHIYRDLLKHLRLPGDGPQGPDGLIEKAADYLRHSFPSLARLTPKERAEEVRLRLTKELQCKPLAWLLSDPDLTEKPLLRQLLAYPPGLPVAEARRSHILPGEPQAWPAFTAGTQGDFASYLLSGLGRLARLLDYKGLVIVMDEMEKWEQLDWKAQCRAGNLFGGLIWGATAEVGHRGCTRKTGAYDHWKHCNHPTELEHSRVAGGYPFSTSDRCFVGVAVAMTPRGENGPEAQWSRYGMVEIIDLPPFTPESVRRYCDQITPLYSAAYGLTGVPASEIAEEAVRRWRSHGNASARTAVHAAVAALDAWRDRGLG